MRSLNLLLVHQGLRNQPCSHTHTMLKHGRDVQERALTPITFKILDVKYMLSLVTVG